MANIENFEDLICWKKSRELTKKIYKVTSDLKFTNDYNLQMQIRKAAVSIMLNIAEGFGRRKNKEFMQFLFIAHGSAAEIQSALYISKDLKYISGELFSELHENCTEISKIISGLIKSLR